jgi:uncharacterized Tic20 family protein
MAITFGGDMAGDDVGSYPESEPYAAEELSNDARTWAMLCHLSAFAGYLVPFGNIFGPLVIWLLKKDEYEFVDFHGKESLNFQITITIAAVVAGFSILLLIGLVLFPAVLLFDVVMKVIAAVKANNGEYFRYPLSIRFIQ